MNKVLIVALVLGFAFVGLAETAAAGGPELPMDCKWVYNDHTVTLPNGDTYTVREPSLVCYG
ncbi:MAG TPA: hypothetical protein VNZ52_01665 [Candidatus Thermoplasmatota archaeon]|nr:hypothetical protein [Candidatus Thermoplasmatota archaeon]